MLIRGEAHEAEFESESVIEGAHYGTDASKLALAGIETVVCAPGDIAQAHTADEFIETEQVEKAVRLYVRLAADWSVRCLGPRAPSPATLPKKR